jgi:hypothetical protein
MDRKLYIISNGLKDLRGHYFETAVSIAEASRGVGLRPVLAAHVTCPSDIVPDGLEFHPVLTTDHWMVKPPPLPPDLYGLRGELVPLFDSPIEALLDGSIGFDRYLLARFLIPLEPVQEVAPPTPPPLGPPGRRERLKNRARRVLPPALRRMIPLSKAILREVTPPVAWDWLRGRLTSRSAAPPLVVPAPRVEDPPRPQPEDPLAVRLARIGSLHEYEYCLRFKQDVERLLCLTGCGPGDHVFLPTAHGREMCAILRLLAAMPAGSRPTFHLEFRHALDMAGAQGLPETEHPYCTVHRAFFDYARMFPPGGRVHLYTDTEELSEEYERFSGLGFGVLPIPFRTRFLGASPRQDDSLCVAYFGDVREEKGFHWLPELIEALLNEEGGSAGVRFLIQASLREPENEPRCKVALDRLKGYSEDVVRLVGLDGSLSPEIYYRLVSEADLLLCPYRPETYRSRSSGTLAEAIAAGIPTVVPRGTWLSRQVPAGGGETFFDRESFIEAVRRVRDDYPTYHARARAGQDAWLGLHSPDRLVRTLLGARDNWCSAIDMVA